LKKACIQKSIYFKELGLVELYKSAIIMVTSGTAHTVTDRLGKYLYLWSTEAWKTCSSSCMIVEFNPLSALSLGFLLGTGTSLKRQSGP